MRATPSPAVGRRRLVVAGLAGALAAAWIPALDAQSYVPVRVFDAARRAFSDFEVMLANLSGADVVLVGERHDDANTHRLELAMLEGLARRRAALTVSLEMFERDVQDSLEHFLMGHMNEAEFLSAARPWPRYETDYKPLVDFAIAKEWAVVAANVPRRFASEVATHGLGALDAKTDAERTLFARELRCPRDDSYFRRFAREIDVAAHAPPGSAPPSPEEARRTLERLYLSQCLKDETMAESIAQAATAGAARGAAGRPPLVVHFNGAFHSDFGEGTAERASRRLPGRRVVVVSIRPVSSLDALAPDGDERKRAAYLVYTIGKTGG
jgi:uncharacterized iron-regulated protein